jgi:hypothetical protein
MLHDRHLIWKGARRGLRGDRREQVAMLREILRGYPQYAKAVAYYGRLLDGQAGARPLLQFLQADVGPRLGAAGGHRPVVREPVPGMQAHRLRVVHHRPRGA